MDASSPPGGQQPATESQFHAGNHDHPGGTASVTVMVPLAAAPQVVTDLPVNRDRAWAVAGTATPGGP